MSLIQTNVDIFVRLMRARFGYYKSPKTHRELSAALIRELQMDSLLAQAYAAIKLAEQTVDRENDELRRLNAELTTRLEGTTTSTPTPAPADHDGGFIQTPKGRLVGTPDDRATLDEIIDRATPDAEDTAGEGDVPPPPDGTGGQ